METQKFKKIFGFTPASQFERDFFMATGVRPSVELIGAVSEHLTCVGGGFHGLINLFVENEVVKIT